MEEVTALSHAAQTTDDIPAKKIRKPKKMDKKLLASKERYEVKYIATKHKIPIQKVRDAAEAAGHNGKNQRSQKKIYLKLVEMGLITDLKTFIEQM